MSNKSGIGCQMEKFNRKFLQRKQQKQERCGLQVGA